MKNIISLDIEIKKKEMKNRYVYSFFLDWHKSLNDIELFDNKNFFEDEENDEEELEPDYYENFI